MLEVRSLHAGYGASKVLQGVDVHVSKGEVVALLGRNGMGKTTLMHAIFGFELPAVTAGQVLFDGRRFESLTSNQRARKGLSLVPQGRRVFPSLTVEENLRIGERPERGSWNLDAVYEMFPSLADRRNQGSGVLSGGEQQMLALGRALMTNPSLLLMDEPSEGLAPAVCDLIEDRLQFLKETSLAVLIAEQNVDLALRVADRVVALGDEGVISWAGSPTKLLEDPEHLRTLVGV